MVLWRLGTEIWRWQVIHHPVVDYSICPFIKEEGVSANCGPFLLSTRVILRPILVTYHGDTPRPSCSLQAAMEWLQQVNRPKATPAWTATGSLSTRYHGNTRVIPRTYPPTLPSVYKHLMEWV